MKSNFLSRANRTLKSYLSILLVQNQATSISHKPHRSFIYQFSAYVYPAFIFNWIADTYVSQLSCSWNLSSNSLPLLSSFTTLTLSSSSSTMTVRFSLETVHILLFNQSSHLALSTTYIVGTKWMFCHQMFKLYW